MTLPNRIRKDFIFADVYKMHAELNRLIDHVVTRHQHNLPRRKAKYDHFKTRHRRSNKNISQ